jgi:uncharacterized protein (TIGR03067 family)
LAYERRYSIANAFSKFEGRRSRKEKLPMSDQEKIQGAWALVSGERNGKPLSEEMIQHTRLIFTGDRLTTQHKDRKSEATFKLAWNHMPKEMDLDMGGNIGKGIYQFDGDTLKIVHGQVGDARPKEFPQPGSGLTVLVLKREHSSVPMPEQG